MPISYVSGANGAGSVTYSAVTPILADDLILIAGIRDGSNSAPSLPSGFTQLQAPTGSSSGAMLAFKWAVGGEQGTAITFTNSTASVLGVYRGVDKAGQPTPASAAAGGTTHPITVPAVTFSPSGDSWVVSLILHRSVDTAIQTPPTGMTMRRNELNATSEGALHDTNGIVTSWSAQTPNPGGTASGWRSFTVQMKEYVAPPPSTDTSADAIMIGW